MTYALWFKPKMQEDGGLKIMNRDTFIRMTQNRFAERTHKAISIENLSKLIDCMVETAIYALQTEGVLKIKNVVKLTLSEPHEVNHYNFFKNRWEKRNFGRKVKATWGKQFDDAVKNL